MGATAELARWIVSTSYEDIPEPAYRVARETCFDCLGVMLAGAAEPQGQMIRDYVQESGGTPECTVVAAGFKTSAAQAALANGTLAHVLDFDDFGGFGHPTAILFPCLLALAEKTGASGRELLGAYIMGVEVGVNIVGANSNTGRYLQMKRGLHSTALIGRMATAAAASKLLGLDQWQTTMALGIAGSMAGGLIHNFGTMTKPLHAGLTARDGVMAAQLARRGWTAGERILEHPAGFVPVFFGEDVADPDTLVQNLGNPWRIQEVLIIKKYPTCGFNHGFLDSLLSILQDNDLSNDDVESVQIEGISYMAPIQMYQEPPTGLTGKFSALYNAARGLQDREVTIETFTDEKATDPRLKEAMAKVHIPVGTKWDPDGDANPVTVRTRDGRTYTRTTTRPQILGSQQNPWGMDNIAAKFRDNARRVLGSDQVEEAVRLWADMAEIKDVSAALQAVVAHAR